MFKFMTRRFLSAAFVLLLLSGSGILQVFALGSWFKTYEQLGNDALPKDPALANKYFDLASKELNNIVAPIEGLSTLDFFRAKAAVCQGDKAHAVALLRQSLDENASANIDAHCIQQKNLLAELLFELGEYDEAEKIVQEIQHINVHWGGPGNPQPTIIEALCNFRRGDESIYRAKMLEGLSRCLNARYQSELFGQCPAACEFIARHDFEALAQFFLIHRENEAALPLLMYVVETNRNSAKSADASAPRLVNDDTLALCLAMVGRIKDADRLNMLLADAYMLKFPDANWIDLQTQRTMQLSYLSDCEKAFGKWDDRTEDARCNLFTGVEYQRAPAFVREQLNKYIFEATSTGDSAAPNQRDDCLAEMLFWRGALNLKENQLLAAQNDLDQSLHLRERLSSRKRKQSVFELSNLLTALAETYSKTNDSAKALAMYQRACDLWKGQPDNAALQQVLDHYADFLTSINKKDAVESMYQKYQVEHPKMNHLVYSSAEVLCF
jgi:tetratricopeptide (TPR) repeat protein